MKIRKWMTGVALTTVCALSLFGNSAEVSAATAKADGSTLGGVPIEGLKEDEAKELVNEKIKAWREGGAFKLRSKYETYEIPRNVFKFHVDASWNDFRDQTKRSWSTFFLKPDRTDVPLVVTVDKKKVVLPERMDQEKTLDNAKESAGMLAEKEPSIVYVENPETLLQPVANVNYNMPDGTDAAAVASLVEGLNDKVIKTDEKFSLLNTIKIPAELKERTQELDFLATALYEMSLTADLTVAEHHAQSELPKYAKPGMEASVNKEMNEDLILINGDTRSYKIEAEMFGDAMEMSLLAIPAEETYAAVLKNETPIESRIVYRYDPSLPAGSEQTEEQGEAGLKVDVYRVHKAADGTMIKETLVRRAAYLPKPQIIMTSSKEDVTPPEEMPGYITGPDGTLIPDPNYTSPGTIPGTGQTPGTTVPGQTTPDTNYPNTDYPGVVNPGTTNPGTTTPGTDTAPAPTPGTGNGTTSPSVPSTPSTPGTDNTNLPSVDSLPPQVAQASPQMKKELYDSLRNDCIREEGSNGRCTNESEIMSAWLLKFLKNNGVINSQQPITNSPDLDGILKGMK